MRSGETCRIRAASRVWNLDADDCQAGERRRLWSKRTRLVSRLLSLRDVQRARNMNDPASRTEHAHLGPESAKRILDPRLGDMENDRSATKQRSFLSIAGSLLAEISLTKLLFVWTIAIFLPAVLLGFAPLVLTAWIAKASSRLAEATGVGATAGVALMHRPASALVFPAR